MISVSLLAGALTLAAPAAQAVLFLQATRRKLLREYSLFVWYTGLQIAKGIVYPIIHHHPPYCTTCMRVCFMDTRDCGGYRTCCFAGLLPFVSSWP